MKELSEEKQPGDHQNSMHIRQREGTSIEEGNRKVQDEAKVASKDEEINMKEGGITNDKGMEKTKRYGEEENIVEITDGGAGAEK